jgi:hypothetical protein
MTTKTKNSYDFVPSFFMHELNHGNAQGLTKYLNISDILTFCGFLYEATKLPYDMPAQAVEAMLSEAIKGSVQSQYSKADVISGDGRVAYQVKTSKRGAKSVVWSRIAIKDKLALITASMTNDGVCKIVKGMVIDKLREGFSLWREKGQDIVYMQVLHEVTCTKVQFYSICMGKVARLLSPELLEARWSAKPTNPDQYPSLGLYIQDGGDTIKLLSWAGLSGNHLHICDLPYFLEEVSKECIELIVPKCLTRMSHSELKEKLTTSF